MKSCTGFARIFLLSLLASGYSYASVCIEGYDDGYGNCIIFNVDNSIPDDTGDDPWDGDGTSIGTGFSGNGFSYTAPGLAGTPPNQYDAGEIFYKPNDSNTPGSYTNNSTSTYPYAERDSYGEPDGSATEPSMWCNKTHHDLGSEFSSTPSYNGPDYNWAYSGVICRVSVLMKNAEDDGLYSNFFTSSYQYSWGSSPVKLKASKITPTNDFSLGISRPKITDISNSDEREQLIDAMYDAGTRLIRLEMHDVSGTDFDRLVDTITYAKTKSGLEVLVAVLYPTASSYYDGDSGDMEKAYTQDPGETIDDDFKDYCGWYGAVKVSSITTTMLGTLLNTAFDEFADPEGDGNGAGYTSDRLDNIIGIELYNEIDAVCFNGDITFAAASSDTTELEASADQYAALLDEARDQIDTLESDLGLSAGTIDLITAGMTKADTREERDNSTDSDYVWDGMDFLDEVFGSSNYVSGSVSGIGHHIYPNAGNIDYELDSLLYEEMRELAGNTYSHSDHQSPVWLTEWGIRRQPVKWPGPGPFYDQTLRYRAMFEFMQNINRDSGSNTTTGGLHDLDGIEFEQVILFGFDFHNGAQLTTNNQTYLDPAHDYRIYGKVDGHYVPIYPEARIFKYFASDTGTGYADSADADSDGIDDMDELSNGTYWFNPDTDGDGLLDGVEDADGDGVVDSGETDPTDPDTDGDGDDDGYEKAGCDYIPGTTGDNSDPTDDTSQLSC